MKKKCYTMSLFCNYFFSFFALIWPTENISTPHTCTFWVQDSHLRLSNEAVYLITSTITRLQEPELHHSGINCKHLVRLASASMCGHYSWHLQLQWFLWALLTNCSHLLNKQLVWGWSHLFLLLDSIKKERMEFDV